MFPLFGRQTYTVSGTVSPGWEPVREEFAREFGLGRRSRAQCCVYHKGQRVVDLWGVADDAKPEPEKQPYDGDSLQIIFSNTKTVTAIAVASLVDRGLIEYHDKISKVGYE